MNLTAGTVTAQGTTNGNSGNIYNSAKLNAVGYNSVDNLLWCQNNGASTTQANGQTVTQLIRVGTEYTGYSVDVVLPSGYSQSTFTVGDVGPNGVMYMTRGGSAEGTRTVTDIYLVDLKQTVRPMVATVVQSAVGSYLTDWAVSPKDTCLYAMYSTITGTGSNTAKKTLYRFLLRKRTVNGTLEPVGYRQTLGTVTVTNGGTAIEAANFASAFMDRDGSFYVMASSTGYIHRIDRPNLLPEAAETTSIAAIYVGTGQIPTADNTDGAFCVRARPTTGALPVQLTAFMATAAPNRTVRLDWTTASELNNAYFEVQHSLDGRTYAVLGQVPGHGSSTQANAYTFASAAPGSDATHYYRLRQVDLDGNASFSPVRAVTLAAGSSAAQLSVAPNPTSSASLRVQVAYAGQAETTAVLTVRGLLGQTLLTLPVALQPGPNVLTPPTALVPGMYCVSLSGNAAVGVLTTKVLVTN